MEYTNQTNPPPAPDKRKLNIIIHGLHEKNTGRKHDQVIIKELFDIVGVKYMPTSTIDRLGSKTTEKIRPIRLSMATQEEKFKFKVYVRKTKA